MVCCLCRHVSTRLTLMTSHLIYISSFFFCFLTDSWWNGDQGSDRQTVSLLCRTLRPVLFFVGTIYQFPKIKLYLKVRLSLLQSSSSPPKKSLNNTPKEKSWCCFIKRGSLRLIAGFPLSMKSVCLSVCQCLRLSPPPPVTHLFLLLWHDAAQAKPFCSHDSFQSPSRAKWELLCVFPPHAAASGWRRTPV